MEDWKRRIIRIAAVVATGLLALTPAAIAQGTAETGKGSGEVRRIDKEAGKVTIRHGPLEGLDMPAMTMVFQVKEPAMLDRLKVGDKIDFTAESKGGALTLLSAAPAK